MHANNVSIAIVVRAEKLTEDMSFGTCFYECPSAPLGKTDGLANMFVGMLWHTTEWPILILPLLAKP